MAKPHAIYDGVLMHAGMTLAVLRDRLMLSPRLHVFNGSTVTLHSTDPIKAECQVIKAVWTSQ
jgi:hypothetical protein